MNRQTSDVQAFEAHATDADLDDLRARLAAARLPEAETVYRAAPHPRRWEQGVPLADLVDVVNYWRTEYDWRSFEKRLNQIGQYALWVDAVGTSSVNPPSPPDPGPAPAPTPVLAASSAPRNSRPPQERRKNSPFRLWPR